METIDKVGSRPKFKIWLFFCLRQYRQCRALSVPSDWYAILQLLHSQRWSTFCRQKERCFCSSASLDQNFASCRYRTGYYLRRLRKTKLQWPIPQYWELGNPLCTLFHRINPWKFTSTKYRWVMDSTTYGTVFVDIWVCTQVVGVQ